MLCQHCKKWHCQGCACKCHYEHERYLASRPKVCKKCEGHGFLIRIGNECRACSGTGFFTYVR